MPSIEITTAPNLDTALAATVGTATVLQHLRLEVGGEGLKEKATHDDTLKRKFKSAYAYAEARTGRALLTQTMKVLFDSDEARSPIELPRWPAQTITSVKEYDADDVATTVASANYRLEGETPATVWVDDPRLIAVSAGWAISREIATLEVVFVAGYGAITAISEATFEGICLLVASLFAGGGRKRRPALAAEADRLFDLERIDW